MTSRRLGRIAYAQHCSPDGWMTTLRGIWTDTHCFAREAYKIRWVLHNAGRVVSVGCN